MINAPPASGFGAKSPAAEKMSDPLRSKFVALLCLAALTLSSCFVRRRVVAPPGAPANRPMMTATKEELLERIRKISAPIQSFNMKADLSPSVGHLFNGELTDYATVRAYILFSRPDSIRLVGLDPVVHSATVFDMASTGRDFRVSIPSRNAFFIGDNKAPPNSKNKLENLRPSAFLSALIVEPPDPDDLTVLEDDTDENKSVYILMALRHEGVELRLIRNIVFDRYTLDLIRQKTFDAKGEIIGETRYSAWKAFDGISYPSTIMIRRPQDGYEVTMTLVDLKFNVPMTQDRFVLEQPSGAKVTQLK